MKQVNDYKCLRAVKAKGRKRRLSARNGLRKTNSRYALDVQTAEAYGRTLELLNSLMNMDVASSVIIRRALRMYAEHVLEITKASKGIEGKQALYAFLNRLEDERAALIDAACHDTPEV